jgi:hypothetical protein
MRASILLRSAWLRALTWLAALPVLSGVCFSVGANPLPGSGTFTHVQSPSPAFCEQVQTMLCEQIVQYTEATGRLEFDLFFWSFLWGEHFDAARLSVVWPSAWGFVEAGVCGGAHGSVDVQGNRATVNASWLPDCPTFGAAAILAARIVLDVTGPGSLEYDYYQPNDFTLGCPPQEQPFVPLEALAGAQAGVECDYCYQDCDFDYLCHPRLTPSTLDIAVPQGLSDQFTIQVIAYGDWDPCAPSFSATENWMGLEVEMLSEYEYLLTLTVDTQGLALGEYSGWVKGEAECRGCTRVNLTVADSQGIEEPSEDPPREAPKSWGGIKSLYR